MNYKAILFILLIINFSSFFCLKCGADLLYQKFKQKYNITPSRIKRRRLNVEYTPIQIKVDYTIMDSISANKDIINTFKSIIDEVANYFNKIILVQHESTDYETLKNSLNNIFKISSFNYNEIYDLYVFPFIDVNKEYLSENIIAGANPYYYSEQSGRPLIGIIILNNNINSKSDANYYIKNTIFHEFFHIFAFSPDLMAEYLYQRGDYKFLNSPKLIEKAKIHFGCDNIQGIRMEDYGQDGTKGTHWDARFMQGELMIGEDYSEIVLSDMTLAFLEDLGFYKVNYYTGGLFKFGKNQGCAFLEKRCLYNSGKNTLFSNEFCTNSEEAFCTGSHTAKGKCFLVKYNIDVPKEYRYFTEPKAGGKDFTDYCPISFNNNKDDNYYYPTNCIYGKEENSYGMIGDNSMCFESSVGSRSKYSVCYKIDCDRSNKNFKVYIGNTEVICNGEKYEISNPGGLSGTLYCPDYNMICTSEIWCNNIYSCINRQSLADGNTYEYIYNKDELKERDNKNLKVDDSLPNGSNSFNKYYFIHIILSFLFLFDI